MPTNVALFAYGNFTTLTTVNSSFCHSVILFVQFAYPNSRWLEFCYIVVLPRVGSHGHRFMISYKWQHPLWMDHMLLKHILLVLYPAICKELNLGSFYLETFYAPHALF